ncbi:MAG: uL22 family ribosomal protein [Patescibacteria group bacterium]|nr:50S ribosomal protein L22 [Patescibacteria group bacterium]
MARVIKKDSQKKPPEQVIVGVRAEARNLPISERKLRLITAAVKKLSPQKALEKLRFLNKKGSAFLIKTIKSAIANAEQKFGLDKEDLVFESIIVSQGPVLKRRDVHHGSRFNGGLIRKPRSHLLVKLISKKS